MNEIQIGLNHRYIWENQCLKCEQLEINRDRKTKYCQFDQGGSTYYQKVPGLDGSRGWTFNLEYIKNKRCGGFQKRGKDE